MFWGCRQPCLTFVVGREDQRMNTVKKVTLLQNEIEAQLIDRLLSAEAIPHLIRSYHDSAYDGIFQGPGGWGHVEAPLDLHPRVKELITEIRRQRESLSGEGSGETEGGKDDESI